MRRKQLESPFYTAEYRKRQSKGYFRDYWFRKSYGLSAAQVDDLIAAQGGLCACCHQPLDVTKPKNVHVDHDHVTKKIRGVLHGTCNRGIGSLGDTAEGVAQALVYLTDARQPECLVDEHW